MFRQLQVILRWDVQRTAGLCYIWWEWGAGIGVHRYQALNDSLRSWFSHLRLMGGMEGLKQRRKVL